MSYKSLLATLLTVGLWLVNTNSSMAQLKPQEDTHRRNRIVAIVNEEVITYYELEKEIKPVVERLRLKFSGNDLRAKISEYWNLRLMQLIENKILLQEAIKKEINIPEKRVEKRFNQLLERAGGDIRMLEDLLAKQGLSLREQKQQILESMMVKTLLDQTVYPTIYISPAHVEAYYKKNYDQFSKKREIRIQNILVSSDLRSKEQAAEKIKAAYADIKDKKLMFDEAVEKYSERDQREDAGKTDFFERGTFLDELEDVAFGLKTVGQYSEPFSTQLGYHIVKLIEQRGGEAVPLEKANGKIVSRLRNERFREKAQEFIQKLKKDAYVKIIEPNS